MGSMRESWTDQRLDDFAANTNRRFDALECRMENGFARLDSDIRELRAETSAFHRMILQLGGGMIVTFAVGFAGLIIAQL
jgi:hypothetical protein